MTKYDKIFKSSKTSAASLSPEEGVGAIAVITAAADSSLEDLDLDSLISNLWNFEIFEEYSEDEIAEIVDKLIYIAEEEGLGALFNTAKKSLDDDVILDAFAAGVMTVLDQEELVIPEKKQPYLQNLKEALDLEDEEAEEIIKEVIAAFEEAEYLEAEEGTVVVEDYSEQVYDSPLGNFSVPIPVDPQQGGRIQSQEGVVGFSDDFGTLLRIDYYPLPPAEIETIESTGLEEYLQSILVEKYVPQAIIANVPNAKIKYSEYLDAELSGAYYILVDMPQGSTLSQQENNGTAIRLDAYRGLLAFIQEEFLYIVSNQRSFLNGQTPGDIEDEAEELKENILDFVDSIEFT